ncbi:MAG: peptidylprolyl isomerase [Candidatus Omnitrophota bacterium]
MKIISKIGFAVVFFIAGCGGLKQESPSAPVEISPPAEETLVKEKIAEKKELRAVMKIRHGDEPLGEIVIKLYPDKAPVTVENFVDLAKGDKMFMDPRTRQQVKRPFYNGLIFHRIIKNFMIQGGCPMGNGTGGPGYRFKDEFDGSLVFDRLGLLAMANSGPGTNGSQFFITTVPTPWLNNRHTIFGEVIEGMDVVKKIEAVKTGSGDRPLESVILEEVIIK